MYLPGSASYDEQDHAEDGEKLFHEVKIGQILLHNTETACWLLASGYPEKPEMVDFIVFRGSSIPGDRESGLVTGHWSLVAGHWFLGSWFLAPSSKYRVPSPPVPNA